MPSFSYCHRHHLDLLSFPTRRSSDLLGDSALEGNPDAQGLSADYEFEPDADTLLSALLPQYVSRILFSMFLERSEEHTSELQSRGHLVCRLLLDKKNSKSVYCFCLML